MADARSWYETTRLLAAPLTTPAAKGDGSAPPTYDPPLIRWNQAVQLARQGETLVLAPLADSATSFAASGHQGFRYLVTFQAAGQPLGGFILEVLSKGLLRSPTQMQATVLQLYDTYRHPRADPRLIMRGFAYFYSVGYAYWGGIEFLAKGSINPARLYREDVTTAARGMNGKCTDYYTQPGGQGDYLGSTCLPVMVDGPGGGLPFGYGYTPDPYSSSGPNPSSPTYPDSGGGGIEPLVPLEVALATDNLALLPKCPGLTDQWKNLIRYTSISIKIVPDAGSVALSSYNASQWTFTTLHESALWNGAHPVSGTRQFSLLSHGGNNWEFAIQSADRINYSSDQILGELFSRLSGSNLPLQFDDSDKLWKAMTANVADFITHMGGTASVNPPFAVRPSWEMIKKALETNQPLNSVPCP